MSFIEPYAKMQFEQGNHPFQFKITTQQGQDPEETRYVKSEKLARLLTQFMDDSKVLSLSNVYSNGGKNGFLFKRCGTQCKAVRVGRKQWELKLPKGENESLSNIGKAIWQTQKFFFNFKKKGFDKSSKEAFETATPLDSIKKNYQNVKALEEGLKESKSKVEDTPQDTDTPPLTEEGFLEGGQNVKKSEESPKTSSESSKGNLEKEAFKKDLEEFSEEQIKNGGKRPKEDTSTSAKAEETDSNASKSGNKASKEDQKRESVKGENASKAEVKRERKTGGKESAKTRKEAKGFFGKIQSFFSRFWTKLSDFFKKLFK